MRQTLDDLCNQLEQTQKQYLVQLEVILLKETSAFQRIQTKDMMQLIVLDMDSQGALQEIDGLLRKSYLAESDYLLFLHDITLVLQNLQECNIPPRLANAYQIIGEAIQSNKTLHMRDVFTCISITLLAAALCMSSLSIPNQQAIVQKLDDLLALKSTQLVLLGQRSKQGNNSSDQVPPIP